MGNVVNRVFDSSGPEGKVRGTPQQIIDKYLALARDAQLGNDRVAAENFLQHAEHYARMLGEAQREQEAMRQTMGGGDPQGRGDGPDDERRDERRDDRSEAGRGEVGRGGQRDRGPREDHRPVRGDVIDFGLDEGSHLIDTPEARAGSEPRDADPGIAGEPDGAADRAAENDPDAADEGARGPGRGRRGRRPRGARGGVEDPASEAAE